MGSVTHKILAFILVFTIVAVMPGGTVLAMPVDEDCTMAGSCEDPAVSSGCQVLCVAGSAACAAASPSTDPDVPHAAPAARPAVSPTALLRAPDTAPPKAPAL